MPASQEQKVDFLLKKIGYSASKTGIAEDESTISTGSNTAKRPFEEGIPSPLIIPQSSLWADSGYIPTTPPGSDTAYVKVYSTSSALRMTRDASIGTNTRTYIAYTTYNNTSSARLTNWIDTQFGASYIVKVYKGDPNSGGVELTQVGGNAGTDGWFFDYSSGILNFNGQNIPSGINATNIYIVGYRYIGATGARPPAGIGTFEHLYVAGVSTFMGSIDANSNLDVAGISTFQGLIDANGLIEATAGQNKIPSLYANFSDLPNAGTYHGMFAHVHQHARGYFAHAGNWLELVNKETDGRVGTGTETYNVGFLDATNLDVTGITTLGSIGISTGRITGPAITYIDPATVGAAGTVVILGNLQVDGTQTTVNSATMTVTDKNILLAKGAANDAAANTGGITVSSGQGDKTWQWLDGNDSWSSSEHIRVADDKVYGWVDDTNTYIGRPAADTIAFTHGGGEKVRIDSSGRVLIGTTTEGRVEADDLTIATSGSTGITLRSGAGSAGNIMFSDGTSGDDEQRGIIQYHHLFNELRFFTNAVKRMTISPTGKVGIGSDNPQELLSIMANGPCGISLIDSGHGEAATTIKIGNTGKDLSINVPEDILSTLTNGNYKVNANGSERFRITGSTGNVGINSSAPSAKLNVGGTFKLGTSTAVSSILDEDNFASDSATALATQQSIKAYVDGGASPSSSLAVSADSGSNESINLVTEVLDIEGTANEIETATGTNKVVIGLPNNVTIGNKLTVTGDVGIGASLSVVGLSTFQDDVTINRDKELIFDRLGTLKTAIKYNDTLTLTQIRNANDPLEIGYRPAHLMWLTNRVLSTKLGGVNITGDTETDTLNVSADSTFTGGATFNGTISAGSTTGTDGYYLKTTGIGVTWAAFPSSRTGLTTSATAGQTTFNFSYNVGYVDVFVNGVKLPESEFTASNGSTIVLDDAAFANDTLEFVSYNTVPNSSAGAQNLTGLADVTISGTPVRGETLQHNGSVFVNDYTPFTSTTSTSETLISGVPAATYRSVEYTVQATRGTNYHVTKLLAIHDGTNVFFNEYGTLFTNSSLASFSFDISSGSIRLLATPTSSALTVFKMKFTGIKV